VLSIVGSVVRSGTVGNNRIQGGRDSGCGETSSEAQVFSASAFPASAFSSPAFPPQGLRCAGRMGRAYL